MSKTVSLGVIGCGKRTESLIRKLRPDNSSIRLVAVCDPLPERRERFRTEFNLDLALYDDEDAFFQHSGLEWVMIGSWNVHHRRHVEKALQARLNIFCEKPLSTTFQDNADLLSLASASNCRVMIGFTLRYSPHYRKIREWVHSGKIGRVLSFEFNETIGFNHGGHILRDWRRRTQNSGGHMLEKCCHDIDLANWIIGSLPVAVASFGGNDFFRPENALHMTRIGKSQSGQPAYCAWENVGGQDHPFTGDCDIIDNQVAILQYGNGVRATFHTNLNAPILERRMYILGTEGALRADVITGKIETSRIGFDTDMESLDMSAFHGSHGGGDDVLITQLRQMMFQNAPSLTTVQEGASSAVVCLALDAAMRERKVVDLRPYWNAMGFVPETNEWRQPASISPTV